MASTLRRSTTTSRRTSATATSTPRFKSCAKVSVFLYAVFHRINSCSPDISSIWRFRRSLQQPLDGQPVADVDSSQPGREGQLLQDVRKRMDETVRDLIDSDEEPISILNFKVRFGAQLIARRLALFAGGSQVVQAEARGAPPVHPHRVQQHCRGTQHVQVSCWPQICCVCLSSRIAALTASTRRWTLASVAKSFAGSTRTTYASK